MMGMLDDKSFRYMGVKLGKVVIDIIREDINKHD